MKRASTGSATIRYAAQVQAGPAAARNTGVGMALGTWLAFTDDDCEPSSGWLQAFERAIVFCDRWTSQGREPIQVADAIVDHMHELSLRSFLPQQHGYGRGAQRFRHQRRAAGRPIRIDPSFYLASLRHAVKARPIARGVALAGCTVLTHTACAAGLARESWRENRAAPARAEHS